MQLGNGIYYSTCSFKAQHVLSGMSLIIRSILTVFTDLIFMDPCIAVQLSINNEQDATW